MTYQELLKSTEKVAQTAKIEVLRQGETAYKLFDKSFEKSTIFYEAMLQTMAEQAGVNVPKIHGITQVDERYAIISEYIEGKTVAQLIDEDPAKTDYYLGLLLDVQLGIHSHVVADVKKLRHKLQRDIKQAPGLDDIKRYELETRLASMPEHNKLCHGNFSPENVVIDGMDRPVVLDWVAATRGNASADIAKTYLRLTLSSTERAERYLALFCERTDTDKRYVNEWLPLVAASYLNTKNLSEIEKRVMLTWLDVVDYE